MTPKEAIDWCEQFTDNIIRANVDTKKRTLGLQAMRSCKSALEKQIPKKPKAIFDEYSYFECGSCGTAIFCSDELKSHIHCLHCGQAIDWSDTE